MKISRESILRYALGDLTDTDQLKLATVQSGWAKGEITITLVPLMLPKNVSRALSVLGNVVHRVCLQAVSVIWQYCYVQCSRHGIPLHRVVTKKQNNYEYTTNATCNLSRIKRIVPSKY